MSDAMAEYAQQYIKRILDNYNYLKKNEYSMDKLIALKDSKNDAEFNMEYIEVKDIVPQFIFKIQETEDMINLVQSHKLKGKETELRMCSDYIKDLKKHKLKKFNSIQKKGEKIPASVIEQSLKKKNSSNSNKFRDDVYIDLENDISERGKKIDILADKIDKIKNDSKRITKKTKNLVEDVVDYAELKDYESDGGENLVNICKILIYLFTIFIIVSLLSLLFIFVIHK